MSCRDYHTGTRWQGVSAACQITLPRHRFDKVTTTCPAGFQRLPNCGVGTVRQGAGDRFEMVPSCNPRSDSGNVPRQGSGKILGT